MASQLVSGVRVSSVSTREIDGSNSAHSVRVELYLNGQAFPLEFDLTAALAAELGKWLIEIAAKARGIDD